MAEAVPAPPVPVLRERVQPDVLQQEQAQQDALQQARVRQAQVVGGLRAPLLRTMTLAFPSVARPALQEQRPGPAQAVRLRAPVLAARPLARVQVARRPAQADAVPVEAARAPVLAAAPLAVVRVEAAVSRWVDAASPDLTVR